MVHGSNWFSITDGLAEYVLDKEEWIYTAFYAGTCVDELFLQSLVMNSSWKHTLYISGYNNGCKGNMRFIHFENGLPHTWRIEEFGRLMESGCCFARKFDETIDEKIITRITEQILDGNPGGAEN